MSWASPLEVLSPVRWLDSHFCQLSHQFEDCPWWPAQHDLASFHRTFSSEFPTYSRHFGCHFLIYIQLAAFNGRTCHYLPIFYFIVFPFFYFFLRFNEMIKWKKMKGVQLAKATKLLHSLRFDIDALKKFSF